METEQPPLSLVSQHDGETHKARRDPLGLYTASACSRKDRSRCRESSVAATVQLVRFDNSTSLFRLCVCVCWVNESVNRNDVPYFFFSTSATTVVELRSSTSHQACLFRLSWMWSTFALCVCVCALRLISFVWGRSTRRIATPKIKSDWGRQQSDVERNEREKYQRKTYIDEEMASGMESVSVVLLLMSMGSTLASPVAQFGVLLPLSSSTPETPPLVPSALLTDEGKQVDHVQLGSSWEPEQFNLPFSVSLSVPPFWTRFLFRIFFHYFKRPTELLGYFQEKKRDTIFLLWPLKKNRNSSPRDLLIHFSFFGFAESERGRAPVSRWFSRLDWFPLFPILLVWIREKL